MIKLLKIGGDPEFILRNDLTGEPVSAIPFIPGTKNNPYIPEGLPEGFGLQTDNVLVEFNIPPVDHNDAGKYFENVAIMKRYIEENFLPANIKMVYLAAIKYLSAELRTKQAKEFGCQPDFNAWTKTVNEKPPINAFKGMRVAGAHIHISYENPQEEVSENFVKLMDLLVTTSVMRACGNIANETERRRMYGGAGAFRFTPYGFEYRVLSNLFLRSYEYINGVFHMINFIAKNYNKLVKTFLPQFSYDDALLFINLGGPKDNRLDHYYKIFEGAALGL